jgi:RNA polymerase sigma factor (sigma-70 family)
MDNQSLIQGILKRDRKTYQWIYDSWFTYVKAYVGKNSGHKDDAQDLFQNALLDLYLNIKKGKYEDKQPMKNYFMIICQNKWLNHLRKNKRKQTVELQIENLEDEDYMEAILHKEGLLNLLEKYLDKMTDGCKAVLNAFYYDKKSLAVIAEENNWTLKFAKKKNYECRQKLKKVISDDTNYKKMVR